MKDKYDEYPESLNLDADALESISERIKNLQNHNGKMLGKAGTFGVNKAIERITYTLEDIEILIAHYGSEE